jgi:hypothetical protein
MALGNSQHVSTALGNSQRVSTALDDSQYQAPLLWHAIINKFLLSIGYTSAHADENLYLRSGVFLLLYVDDTQILYPPSVSEAAADIKVTLKKEYKMTDLSEKRNSTWA